MLKSDLICECILWSNNYKLNFFRKGSLLICGILFTIGAILFYTCRAAKSVELLLLGRLIVGLASGLTTSTVPMYLAELAPLELRGTLAVLASMGLYLNCNRNQ